MLRARAKSPERPATDRRPALIKGVNVGRKNESPVSSPQEDPGSSTQLFEIVLASLDQDKAEDIVSIELAGKSSLADYMVIASGRSSRQVTSMADHLLERIRDAGFGKARVEGLPQADWVLIDAGDVVVHLFRPEVRDFYQLEKMWSVELVHGTAN